MTLPGGADLGESGDEGRDDRTEAPAGDGAQDLDGPRQEHDDDPHGDDEHVAAAVRPYTLTGGRTRPTSEHLPFEALVEGIGRPDVSLTPERRRILELTAGKYLSIAELSAHLHLPVAVVRVVVGDLAEAGSVRVHGLRRATAADPASTTSVLESVLHGIFSL